MRENKKFSYLADAQNIKSLRYQNFKSIAAGELFRLSINETLNQGKHFLTLYLNRRKIPKSSEFT